MKGIIIVNAYSKLSHGLNQAYRIKQELELRGIDADIVPNNRFLAYLQGGGVVSRAGEYGFCVYLDKDKYVSRLLELSGMRLFNSHEAIRVCDDKLETFAALAGQGLAMPLTLPGLLCYDEKEQIDLNTVRLIEEKLSYPLVIKSSYGSLGEGVYLAHGRERLVEVMNKLKLVPHLFEQYIASSCGRDMRVIVIGGFAAASMLRVSGGDFRSNLELGGHGSVAPLPESFRQMSERAARLLGLDYCGVDLLFGEDGEPVLCEVNSNAFFGGIEAVTGVNVAGLYCEHIIKTVS